MNVILYLCVFLRVCECMCCFVYVVCVCVGVCMCVRRNQVTVRNHYDRQYPGQYGRYLHYNINELLIGAFVALFKKIDGD